MYTPSRRWIAAAYASLSIPPLYARSYGKRRCSRLAGNGTAGEPRLTRRMGGRGGVSALGTVVMPRVMSLVRVLEVQRYCCVFSFSEGAVRMLQLRASRSRAKLGLSDADWRQLLSRCCRR
jgi:hypothetical protein